MTSEDKWTVFLGLAAIVFGLVWRVAVIWLGFQLYVRAVNALDNYNGQFESDTAPSCTVSA